MTKCLEALLDNAYTKVTTPNIYCLKSIFTSLRSTRHYPPEVEDLKAKGPEEFA